MGLVLAGLGCRTPERAREAPLPRTERAAVDARLFLIGDTGEPETDGEPVLIALARDLATDPARSWAVFLGDVIYPDGMPEEGHPDRAEAEQRLDVQLEVLRASRARGIFLPGNHDWRGEDGDGWDAVRRQAAFVESRAGGYASYLPRGGCPGPEVVDLGAWLRLVALDTEWWLGDGPKPEHPTSECATDSPVEVVDSLRGALRDAGERRTVVVAHHPLESAGVHGGSFGLMQHLFPLRELKSWLWVPLPIVGSLYPLVRGSGVSSQDIPSDVYGRMLDHLDSAFGDHPPLVYAGGHEHNLQVIQGVNPRYLLVSGAGIYGHQSAVWWRDNTLFAAEDAGFMRLDVFRDGGVRLTVVVVDEDAKPEEIFSIPLELTSAKN